MKTECPCREAHQQMLVLQISVALYHTITLSFCIHSKSGETSKTTLSFMNEMSELSKFGNIVQVIYAGDAIKHDTAIEVLI